MNIRELIKILTDCYAGSRVMIRFKGDWIELNKKDIRQGNGFITIEKESK